MVKSTGEKAMPKLLAQNSKMKKSQVRLFNFGIPAFKSKDGFNTCPNAGICAKYCYAKKGTYRFSNVTNAYEYRLAATMKDSFVDLMNHEIQQVKASHVRIHDSGDFYSFQYFLKWKEIIEANPSVTFYAYTKQVKMFKGLSLPSNFTLIYSLGGKLDSMIDTETMRHSKIFESIEELEAQGYTNASNDDLIAINENNHRIGLLSH
jgi:hypothetical protein